MRALRRVRLIRGGLLIRATAVLVALLRQRTHFLTALLALELLVIIVIIMLVLAGLKSGQHLDRLVFVLLALGACEARLGLSLLVAIVRSYGNDLLKSLRVNKV